MELQQIFEKCKSNAVIFDAYMKADQVINQMGYKNIAVSISGGADSDVILDIVYNVMRGGQNVHWVWFDTGLEYQATKEHLIYLEDHYGITIEREKAKVPIPVSNKEFGEPFISKYVSEMISRLQRHDFDFKDRPYEEAMALYPNCTSALKWFYNKNAEPGHKSSSFNIEYHIYLREFMIANPPNFKISGKCCDGAKKHVSKNYVKNNDIDLMVVGIRKSEGGARSGAYKNCFSATGKYGAMYRPIFWFADADRADYEKLFEIQHSKCYTEYGLKRTGCAACPFSRNRINELGLLNEYEPNLANAARHIFANSYEYTRQFYEFREKMRSSN